MVKVTKQDFYMDGYLKSNLDLFKQMVKRDFDCVMCVDGTEGAGKSVLAAQIAYYLDNSLTLDRITFTAEDFKQRVLDAEKHQAIIFDEAYGALSARQAMSLVNRTIIDMLAEIRQKNLFLIIVLPCFFDLDRIVALWRSKFLIHVYMGERFERGRFSFFNRKKKKTLYMLGKKFYNYNKPSPNFIGRFTNHYVVDEQAYRDKKLVNLRATKPRKDEIHKWLMERNMLITILHEEYGLKHQEIADMFHKHKPDSMSRQGITKAIATFKRLGLASL